MVATVVASVVASVVVAADAKRNGCRCFGGVFGGFLLTIYSAIRDCIFNLRFLSSFLLFDCF